MSNVKRYKKGERLFSEGEMTDKVFILQSGRVSLFIERGGKRIELDQASAGQLLGEHKVFSNAKASFNAEALSEVKALEVPAEIIKVQHEKSAPGIKILSKALCDEVRRLRNTIRSYKMEQDNSPCPQRYIPRLFSTITLVGHHMGSKPEVPKENPVPSKVVEEVDENPLNTPDDLILSWTMLRLYATRMFMESPQRMQSMLELLSKLKYVSLKYEVDEEEEEEQLSEIRIHDIETIEQFGEFFQHNLFKAGRSEMIYLDQMAFKVAGILIDLSEGKEVDRNGVVDLEYESMLHSMKSDYGIDLKDTHLNILEKKGLFVKRRSRDNGVFLSFERREFETVHTFWQILNEIEKWNKKGFVDVNEDLTRKKVVSVATCPSCKEPYQEGQNFCATCGFKLTSEGQAA